MKLIKILFRWITAFVAALLVLLILLPMPSQLKSEKNDYKYENNYMKTNVYENDNPNEQNEILQYTKLEPLDQIEIIKTKALMNLRAPAYPKTSRWIPQKEGMVTYKAWYSNEGEFIKAKIVSSSGYGELDDAALKSISKTYILKPYDILRNSEQTILITCGFQNGISSCKYK